MYHWTLYCSTPWVKVKVIPGVSLMVKCWRILAGQFSAPCPAQQQHQQGETQIEKRIWPLQKKKWPFDLGFGLPWVSSGCFSAERGSLSRQRDSGSPLLDVDVSYLEGNPAGWLIWGLAGPTSPSIPSFYYAAFKHTLDMKERHTVAFLMKAFT